MNYGYIAPVIKRGDYVSDGKIRLAGLPLVPSGDWSDFLPPDEHQTIGVETQACTVFGTLNAVEMLERRLYGESNNWSDRFLAKMSDITRNGQDPHTTCEVLRKKGVCHESDWPNSADLDTWEKFYADLPENLKTLALEFKAKYDFGHQYVSPDYASIKNALRYSPLGIGVFAWAKEGDVYVRPLGAGDTHWCVLYGFYDNGDWKVYDSYPDGTGTTRKRLRADFGFSTIKEYTLHKNVVNDTAWGKFVALLRKILGVV